MYINPLYSAFLGFGAITSACSISDTKWTNFTSKIINVEPNNAVIKHQVGGSVKIINGCSFSVKKYDHHSHGNGVYWWGIPVTTIPNLPRVVAAAMIPLMAKAQFSTLTLNTLLMTSQSWRYIPKEIIEPMELSHLVETFLNISILLATMRD